MSGTSEKAPDELLKDVEKFDHAELKAVEEKDKTPSQARDMAMAGELCTFVTL